MPSAKELFQQRKAAKGAIKGRVPIVWVLLMFGFFLIFAVLSIVTIGSKFRSLMPIMLGLAGGTFLFYLFLAIKYNKAKTSEQEKKKVSAKNAIGSLLFMIIFLGLIIFGLSFFIWLSSNFPFSPGLEKDQGRLIGVMIIALIVYFAASPFIMALWYKTAPGVGVKLIVRAFKAFNWKSKDKACEIMVFHSVQEHSFTITFKRAFTALVYSLTLVFSLSRLLGSSLPPGWGREMVIVPEITGINDLDFINYCTSLIIAVVIPLVVSFVIFFWALPSSYLLDDAGVVYYKKYINRRQPAELRTVSQWFLGIVQAVMGTSGVISYFFYVFDHRYVVAMVYSSINALPIFGQPFATLCAIQFGVFVFGFPLLGTVLMAYILQLFQESQYNKLKTSLFQELVNAKIDPRVVQVKFERMDEFQERTLMNYTGENFFHNPPLKDSVSKLPPAGDLAIKDMLKK
jgi:heme/copper-type cytochrome/quinol oxidase subunit 2